MYNSVRFEDLNTRMMRPDRSHGAPTANESTELPEVSPCSVRSTSRADRHGPEPTTAGVSAQDVATSPGPSERDLYVRLHDYCRHMYEEEKDRSQRLNDAVKVYLGFTSFIVGIGALKLVTVDQLAALFKVQALPVAAAVLSTRIGTMLFFVSFALFAASAVCTILVLKVWRFERLCDPEHLVVRTAIMESEMDLLSSMVADYAVAANRNYEVNERKAKLLSYGLLFLMCAVLLFGCSWFFAKLLPLV